MTLDEMVKPLVDACEGVVRRGFRALVDAGDEPAANERAIVSLISRPFTAFVDLRTAEGETRRIWKEPVAGDARLAKLFSDFVTTGLAALPEDKAVTVGAAMAAGAGFSVLVDAAMARASLILLPETPEGALPQILSEATGLTRQ